MKTYIRLGLDIGSTTIKLVAMDEEFNILYKKYMRHYSSIKETIISIFTSALDQLKDSQVVLSITGSGGFSVAKHLAVQFVQEVVASTKAIEVFLPETDVAIELGGEDAKITYLSDVVEQRMNGTCAGGTGSFIDQMASLIQTDASGLNDLAKNHSSLYSIASRCGVFAKSDIQPLLNDGAKKENIAVSILQAVVNQTIGGLSQGKSIQGNVALLGGPLFFMSELRKRFQISLGLSDDEVLVPEDGHFFVAMGAALSTEKKEEPVNFSCLYDKVLELTYEADDKELDLEALFTSEEEYTSFKERHDKAKVKRGDLSTYAGDAFLGIDAGSTTTKVALIDSESRLLYEHYSSNKGNPLDSTISALQDLYSKLNDQTTIRYSTVTGYGEKLIQEALLIDSGEIETVAHVRAAREFLPSVDFVIDIGGQDMKSMQIKDGYINSIMLNEACSSGCGSFIETFASSVNMSISDFANLGISSKAPVDLGTRCTVFMNSRVKQAQKEGASPADISAGISLSVIKNALFKVIRLRSPEEMGENIVVQGGTFYNDSVLRAMEIVSKREVVRPDIAGLMGAFGCAVLSKERYESGYETAMLGAKDLLDFNIENDIKRCELCGNHCLMTVNTFSDGRSYVTGNRCERGIGLEVSPNKLPNLYDYKYKRTFGYKSLPEKDAHRGVIGIPRALNIYEDYPFWHTFFTELGYRVVISRKSSHDLFEEGMDSIPSESVCYPAKLAHGHIKDLISQGVSKIFYPSIPYTIEEDSTAGNHYSCPIVTSYPETLRVNMDELRHGPVTFINPFLPLDDEKRLVKRLAEELSGEKLSLSEIKQAVRKAYEAHESFKKDIHDKGEETLKLLQETGQKGIVLCGRPYHVDPEINHGVPELISSYGFAVFTEDSLDHLQPIERPLRVVDQWVYHNRMYRAASFAARQDNLEVIQLVSFGCGLDAVTTDQISELLDQYNKIYTMVKIDEISNLGAIRIRVRSLLAALKEREAQDIKSSRRYEFEPRVLFTKKMRESYTILAPQMAPMHFELIESALRPEGYNLKLLPSVDKKAIDVGLQYVHNDACYPTIITVGQIMNALKSGEYDLESTAVIISQTGGGCRATNYIAFIKKALKDAGMSHIPVISLNAVGLEKHPGFRITPKAAKKMVQCMIYGDLLMRLVNRTRPYEKVKGSVNALHEKWATKLKRDLSLNQHYKENMYKIVQDFDRIPIYEDIQKPRVGVVGEILVKFHPTANNNLVDLLEREGAEAVVPDLTDFFLYSAYNSKFKHENLSGTLKGKYLGHLAIEAIELMRKDMKKALEKSKRFHAPRRIEEVARGASNHLSLGHTTGEGWFLTGEMVELLEEGVENILCLQPFACLPNHITGKGMVKELRTSYPRSNIVPIDYDPGASEVNQLNRIKLMLSTAVKNLDRQHA